MTTEPFNLSKVFVMLLYLRSGNCRICVNLATITAILGLQFPLHTLLQISNDLYPCSSVILYATQRFVSVKYIDHKYIDIAAIQRKQSVELGKKWTLPPTPFHPDSFEFVNGVWEGLGNQSAGKIVKTEHVCMTAELWFF